MTTPSAARPAVRIDPRGARFGAALTSLVLAGALLAESTPLGYALLTWQVLCFTLGVFAGPGHTPYALVFRSLSHRG